MAETVFAVSQSDPTRPVRRLAIDRACVTRRGAVYPPQPVYPLEPIYPHESAADPLILLSNGRPIDNCAVRILRDGEFVEEAQIGEICVRADFMFSGYHHNPDATAEAFHGDWYRTGDLGFLDDGEVFVVGRLKDVIIVNGKNILAHDVEAAVSLVGGVKPGRCVAFGRYDEKIGSEQLIVIAERSGDAAQDGKVIREINHAVIKEISISCADIRMVDQHWLVKTTSGKISRSDNAVKYAACRLAEPRITAG
jgi:acyl-CoA synthetase (AMP-forming)/AMP-acid ligase II